jgi:protein-S-isoprenylcysteine O-methyltransferase Ste14
VFGWRSVAAWRATGDSGFWLDAGPAGSPGWWAKLLLVVALVLGVAGPVVAGSGMAALWDVAWLRWVGLAFVAAGVVAPLLAQAAMGNSWRVGVDPAERAVLVIAGVSRLVRNPIYATMIATSLGLAVAVPNPVSLAATAMLVVAIQVQVRVVKAPYLLRMRGADYTCYTATVGRFIPSVGRLPTSTGA